MVFGLKHHHSITPIVTRQPAGIFHHDVKFFKKMSLLWPLVVWVSGSWYWHLTGQLPETHRPKFLLYDWLCSSVGRWSNYWVVYWLLSLPGWKHLTTNLLNTAKGSIFSRLLCSLTALLYKTLTTDEFVSQRFLEKLNSWRNMKMLNTFVKYSQELNQNPLVCFSENITTKLKQQLINLLAGDTTFIYQFLILLLFTECMCLNEI